MTNTSHDEFGALPITSQVTHELIEERMRAARALRNAEIGKLLHVVFALPCKLLARLRMNTAQASRRDGLSAHS